MQKFYNIAKARPVTKNANAEPNLNTKSLLPLLTPQKENETENSTKNGPHTDIQNGETGQVPNTHDMPSNP